MNATLHARLQTALRRGSDALDALESAEPDDERDRLLVLSEIHDLHCGPLDSVGEAARWQHHPTVAGLKVRLEREELSCFASVDPDLPTDAVEAMRMTAAKDSIPPVYDWLANEATWEELVEFLAAEGGPDGGFDDLVAVCQAGLSGRPKLEMARNYWDEMGRGTLDDVHTELHRDLGAAIEMPRIPRDQQPVSALRRSVLGNILATNRCLQPEMTGALGLTEMQAGPRCRRVLQAFDRLGAPQGAYPFYAEHAETSSPPDPESLERNLRALIAGYLLAQGNTEAAQTFVGTRQDASRP